MITFNNPEVEAVFNTITKPFPSSYMDGAKAWIAGKGWEDYPINLSAGNVVAWQKGWQEAKVDPRYQELRRVAQALTGVS